MKKLPEKYIKEPTGYPFSPVLSIDGKQIIVTSGTCCDDFDGTIPDDIESQARNTIKACENFIKEAGCTLEDVFNVEVYMRDLAQWDDFNRVYKELMPQPMPCRKALQVGLLPGYLVEIVMWAVKPEAITGFTDNYFKLGDYFVKPVPQYMSQFASRNLVSGYLDKRITADSDSKWRSFGFDKIEDYEFWMMRLCGLICVKMVLNTFSATVAGKTIAEFTQDGISMGGYKVYDEDGNFIDTGWFYQPLIELAREYGVDGHVYKVLTVSELCELVRRNAFPIISVNPKVIRGDIDSCEKKGGHLVLVVGFRWGDDGCEGFYIHNPSGREYSTQEKAFVSIERFTEAFAGRGFALFSAYEIGL